MKYMTFDRQIDILTDRQTDRHTHRHVDRQTEGQTDRQTDRLQDRHIGRQIDKQTEILLARQTTNRKLTSIENSCCQFHILHERFALLVLVLFCCLVGVWHTWSLLEMLFPLW